MSNTFILGINESVDGSYHMPTPLVYDATGQNVGNLAFHYAMGKILGGGQKALAWHLDPQLLNAGGDIGVMPCANQLGAHADYGRLGERFSDLTIGLVAVGLGAQGNSDFGQIPVVPEGTQNWVREIVARAPTDSPNIGVRGPFTLRVLEHYGLADKAIVTGCPTLFLNPEPNLGQAIRERATRGLGRIAIAAGHQKWKQLSKIEASIVKLMEKSDGFYIVQSPIEMVALARGEAHTLSTEALLECRDYINPHMSVAEFISWSLRYGRAFFNVSEWMEQLRSCDFVVGTRIHGVMMGLQAGIPGLCIVHDSRTREMCEVMKVPFVMAKDVIDGVDVERLETYLEFDFESFDLNRRNLAGRLSTFMLGNKIPSSRWLEKIAS